MTSLQKAQDLARRYKMQTGCKVCGYNEHFVALHYNHLDPTTKTKEVSRCRSVKSVKHEIRKCEVLCANCHAVKSFKERHHFVGKQNTTRADIEKRKLVKRLALSRRRTKKEKGRCEGRKPYADQVVIQQIQKLRKQGKSYQSIADTLNKEQTPSPGNSRWVPTSVRRVFKRTNGK